MLKSSVEYLKGRGLYVMGDAAGAKSCLAQMKFMEVAGEITRACCTKEYSFFLDFGARVLQVSNAELSDLMDDFAPEYIFTGTSFPAGLEMSAWSLARSRGIQTIGFIDHWINLKIRFQDRGQKLVVPDEIWVIDEKAYEFAIQEGLPVGVLKITGNPYHQYLKQWRPNIDKVEFHKKIGLPINKRYVLYAPECISTFKLQDKYGFDEFYGLDQLIEAVKKLDDLQILVKLHPNHDDEFKAALNKHAGRMFFQIVDEGLNELLYFATQVAGFFSNSLIEASILHKKVIRLLGKANPQFADPLRHMNIGVAVYNVPDLEEALK
jgi:hypothetical protein